MEYNVSLERGVKAGDICTDDGRFTQLPDIDRSIVFVFTTVLYKKIRSQAIVITPIVLCVFSSVSDRPFSKRALFLSRPITYTNRRIN